MRDDNVVPEKELHKSAWVKKEFSPGEVIKLVT